MIGPMTRKGIHILPLDQKEPYAINNELKLGTLIIAVLLLKTTVTTTIFSPFILRKIDFVNLFKFHKI